MSHSSHNAENDDDDYMTFVLYCMETFNLRKPQKNDSRSINRWTNMERVLRRLMAADGWLAAFDTVLRNVAVL